MGRGNESNDNVVRFPRDWLGPREELVPLGPSAGTTNSEVDEELPRSGDDFWGEQSGAVHDAVRATDEDGAGEDEPACFGVRDGTPGPTGRRRGSGQGRRRGPFSRVRAGCQGLPARVSQLRARSRGRHAGPKLAASLAVAAMVLAGLLTSNGTRQPPPGGASAHRSAQLPAEGATAAGSFLTLAPHLRLGTRRSASHARSAASSRQPARAHRHHSGVRRSTRHNRAHRAPPATVQPVHYTPPSSASSGTTGSASSASARSTPVSSPSATTASTGTSGGQSASGSPPAFGSNGTLGPGSSPDS